MGKVRRRVRGFVGMVRSIVREPRLAQDLPRWTIDARIRRDPLAYRRPWWNYNAIRFVESQLGPESRVFEYGGGASTLWLLDFGCRVTTVEHDPGWHASLVAAAGPSATVLLRPETGEHGDYVDSIAGEPDGSLDLVVVDGRARVRCALAARQKVRPGGLLMLDDSERERYLPLRDHLKSWRRLDFRGLKAGDWLPRQTSVWVCPDVN